MKCWYLSMQNLWMYGMNSNEVQVLNPTRTNPSSLHQETGIQQFSTIQFLALLKDASFFTLRQWHSGIPFLLPKEHYPPQSVQCDDLTVSIIALNIEEQLQVARSIVTIKIIPHCDSHNPLLSRAPMCIRFSLTVHTMDCDKTSLETLPLCSHPLSITCHQRK